MIGSGHFSFVVSKKRVTFISNNEGIRQREWSYSSGANNANKDESVSSLPGVDDSDGDKHVENKLVWNFNSNGKSRRNEFILTAKIVQAVDLQDFRRCNFEGDFFFVGVRIN